MALYTQLTAENWSEVARAYGLGDIRQPVGIPQGSINTNYRFETAQGRLFVRHTTVRSAEDLEFEAGLLRHLSEVRFPSPTLVPTTSGKPFLELAKGRVSLFHYLAGDELHRAQVTPEHVEALGEELGKLHRVALSYVGERANPYSPQVVEGWLADLQNHPDTELSALARELTRLLARASQDMGHLLPRGPIHTDLFLDNVKWVGNRVSAFFDFEMACRDAWVLDLAITLNAWCFSEQYDPVQTRALVRGYQRERPLGPEERRHLYAHALFGAIRYTTSRIRDFHLSPLPPERLTRKDFRTYLARVRTLEHLGPQGFNALCGLG